MVHQNKNPFKDLKLDKEEERILRQVGNDKFVVVKNLKATKKRYKRYAQNTLNKLKNINIRINMKDLQKLKLKAAENGLPYQTLASTILHHYSNNKINIQI